MIDTVKLYLDIAEVGSSDLMATTAYLTNTYPIISTDTGEVRGQGGYLSNLRVYVFPSGVTVEGSMPRYLMGSNAHVLTRHQVEESINKMSDELHLPMAKAEVRRVDCASLFIMSHPIQEYIQRLNGLTRYSRVLHTHNSLTYLNGKYKTNQGIRHHNVIAIYNKSKELTETGKDTPEAYDEANVLRIERRWIGGVRRAFGLPELTAATLSESEFYGEMVRRWGRDYFAIQKSRTTAFKFEGVTTPKDFEEWLLGVALNRWDATDLDNILMALREREVLKYPKYYTSIKAKLKQCRERVSKDVGADLMQELDNYVRNTLIYIR